MVQHTIFSLFLSLLAVIDRRCFSTEATPCAGLARTVNELINIATMASNDEAPPDPTGRTFRLGNSVFSCGEARRCYLLLKEKVTVWQIKEMYYPNASLKEIVAAIQIGIMLPDIRLDDLGPPFFDVDGVCLEMWNIGYPTQNQG